MAPSSSPSWVSAAALGLRPAVVTGLQLPSRSPSVLSLALRFGTSSLAAFGSREIDDRGGLFAPN